MQKIGPVWPYLAPCGPISPRLPRLALFDPVGPIWLRLVQFGPVWSRFVPFGPICPHLPRMAPLGHFLISISNYFKVPICQGDSGTQQSFPTLNLRAK